MKEFLSPGVCETGGMLGFSENSGLGVYLDGSLSVPPQCHCPQEIRAYLDVSENNGIPKSSILIQFSIINHPFGGTPIFGNTHLSTTIIPY